MVAVALLQIVVGVVVLLAAAEGIVRAGSALGLRIGLSPLWIGLTIVALGTSAPELVVSVAASSSGAGNVAVGNVVGSNILNILIVLGATAIIRPVAVSHRTATQDIPIIALLSMAILGLAWYGRITRVAGAALVLCAIAYTVYVARRERMPITPTSEDDMRTRPTWLLLLVVVVAIFALVGGGRMVLDGAVDLATAWGLSQRVIGLTIVALGTSLPELAVSIAAAIRGRVDLAIGNIVGSNLLNSTLILGSAALAAPLDIPHAAARLDIPIMMIATLMLWSFAARERRVTRIGAALFLMIYTGYAILMLSPPAWSWLTP